MTLEKDVKEYIRTYLYITLGARIRDWENEGLWPFPISVVLISYNIVNRHYYNIIPRTGILLVLFIAASSGPKNMTGILDLLKKIYWITNIYYFFS